MLCACRNPAYADVKVLQAAILCQQLASFSTMLGAEASGTHSLPVVLGRCWAAGQVGAPPATAAQQ